MLRSWDGREQAYDLLVTIPTHRGAAFVGASGLGNELDFIPTERHTLLAKGHDDIFVLGDATDLPSSKAGSVAHFQSEVVVENLPRTIDGRSLEEGFDGHANCFIESGFGKALLIDFNYDVEPLPGRYPLPWLGPMTLLGESRINHWGKLGPRAAPGSKKLTPTGRRFLRVVKDMKGLRKWLEDNHPGMEPKPAPKPAER